MKKRSNFLWWPVPSIIKYWQDISLKVWLAAQSGVRTVYRMLVAGSTCAMLKADLFGIIIMWFEPCFVNNFKTFEIWDDFSLNLKYFLCLHILLSATCYFCLMNIPNKNYTVSIHYFPCTLCTFMFNVFLS